MENFTSKIKNKPRSSTPERLKIKSHVGEHIGEGCFSYVRKVTGLNSEDLVVKIPMNESVNQIHHFEYCFKKAAHDYLKKEHGYEEPPIVLPYNITESSSLFASKSCKNPLVFTMDRMDSDLYYVFDGKSGHENPVDVAEGLKKELQGTIEILDKSGFLIEDMHEGNIFVKDSKAYLGDCGGCLIQKGTKAEVYFNKAVKEAGFSKYMLSGFIVSGHSAWFSL